MNSKKIIFTILTIIIIGIVVVILQAFGVFTSLFAKKGTVRIHEKTYTVEIVSKEKDRAKGLSNRTSLAQNKGMLFIFDSAEYHAFWMKDMRFSIDMIFIKDKKIVTIYRNVLAPTTPEENANPPVYTPTTPADKVLELTAGEVDANAIQEGDSVIIDL